MWYFMCSATATFFLFPPLPPMLVVATPSTRPSPACRVASSSVSWLRDISTRSGRRFGRSLVGCCISTSSLCCSALLLARLRDIELLSSQTWHLVSPGTPEVHSTRAIRGSGSSFTTSGNLAQNSKLSSDFKANVTKTPLLHETRRFYECMEMPCRQSRKEDRLSIDPVSLANGR